MTNLTSDTKKCCGCGQIHGDEQCPTCKCILGTPRHPIWGFDTPDSIRKEVKEVKDVLSEVMTKQLLDQFADEIILISAVLKKADQEDIDKIINVATPIIDAYANVAIAIMEIADKHQITK